MRNPVPRSKYAQDLLFGQTEEKAELPSLTQRSPSVPGNHMSGSGLLLCHSAFSACMRGDFPVPSPSAGIALSKTEEWEKFAFISLCNPSGFGLLKIESDS